MTNILGFVKSFIEVNAKQFKYIFVRNAFKPIIGCLQDFGLGYIKHTALKKNIIVYFDCEYQDKIIVRILNR